ncbi:MAG TPA: hypothetical protein VLA09_03980, partial [Longimicrobiales bacterium]|nr:hypothetical protein [Longimicrobiales bacterium]
ITLSPSTTTPLYRVPAAGGEPEPFTTIDTTQGFNSHRWPALLPGGRAAAFTEFGGGLDDAFIAVADLETGAITRLSLRGLRPQWAPSGHLVYGTADGSIVAVPFDPAKREVTGAPVSLLEGVMVRVSILAEFAVSQAGHLIYLSGEAPDLSLALVDSVGIEEILVEDLREPEGPRASPDGRRIALAQIDAGHTDIWVYDRRERTMTRMTFEGNNRYPVWSPDGTRIAFSHSPDRSPRRAIWWVAADGSGTPQELFDGEGDEWEVAWLPNGRDLVVRSISGTSTSRDLWWIPAEGEAVPFVATEFNERSAAVSPDGRWVAYGSNESGRDEVYVRPLPGPGGKRQVSAEGGSEPLWSRDGRMLFYRGPDRRFYSVEVRTAPTLAIGQRRPLFEDRYGANTSHTNYDLLPDGRFVALKGSNDQTNVVLVLNWVQELKQRVRN